MRGMNAGMMMAVTALFAAALASPQIRAEGGRRVLLYPTVARTGSNILANASWSQPNGDTPHFAARTLKGGPFSDAADAWSVTLLAPDGAYWRAYPAVEKGRTYLYGAWVRIDNANILLRSYGTDGGTGKPLDQRLYCYGGFNAYLRPYLSERMAKKLAGDPGEWKLCYRLLSFPNGVKGGRFCAAMGVYLSTGTMTFSEPFLIDVTDAADRSLTVDVSGDRPFRRLAVVATGLGDIMWSKDFAEPVTSFKGTVPADRADFARGQDAAVIEGHTLEVTYADGTSAIVHSPQEKTFAKRM